LDFDWKPKNFGAVVQKVTSAQGEMLSTMLRQVSKTGYLSCPPPAWDPEGLYRVGANGSRVEVQRLGDDNRWQACAIRPGGKREKQQKFGILDSPTLLPADLDLAVGPMGASLLYLDIDDFKAVNTALTERVVDRTVLPELQRIVDRAAQTHGYAYAEGGDEMIVLLPNVAPLVGLAFAEALRELVSKSPFVAEGRTFKLTVSIGLAIALQSVPVRDLPERANRAKAHAKSQGKNAVAICDADGVRCLRLRYDAAPTSVRGPFIKPR
jgi:diguanylate cyclase (GGDEF)-like protein